MLSRRQKIFAAMAASAPPRPGVTDPRTECIPWTAGGDLAIERSVKITPMHYLQADNSLNAALWDLVPVEENEETLQRLWDASSARIDALPSQDLVPYDTTVLLTGVPIFELSCLIGNLRCLHALADMLDRFRRSGPPIPTVYEVLGARKSRGKVEPLPEVVRRLGRSMNEANQLFATSNPSNLLMAIEKYRYCLLDLYPWSATPLLFSPEQAFDLGIAQLQSALWCNLALTTHKLAQFSGAEELFFQADACAVNVVNMRFATRTTLSKAYKILSEMHGHLAFRDGLGPTSVQAARDTQEIAKNQELLSRLIHMSSRNKSGWAHRDCITDHSGCGCGKDEVYTALGLDPRRRYSVSPAQPRVIG